MTDIEIKEKLNKALINGDSITFINLLEESILKVDSGDQDISILRDIIKLLPNSLSGLKIQGYEGDFPTFIEPVNLTPGVKIGDTVLLGPNVLIGKDCQLGDFCELSNTILFNGIKLGKHCKLNYCIVNNDVELPSEFEAKESLIYLKKGKLEIKNL